ncbi:Alcohol dehydrogenase superfamily, zinc-type [Penicillium expansum]|uniref:Alcohol dehydrogenase superfamily, zinc-type n=1 Tax=Penicillium expansum TaxID=27334 RepID=A0A0A2K1N4_PENEN|nr:Alcohol dehydrogenase superfamily, zinc-type [Penicillium expansum]KGO38945.1 Alcohol dehydrogenase superfamily, zinc-type [Penicillium expansum]KGO60991.1 Alcohol dehydrogenase superfamily, zinc-type [Penicillium expansum]KGO62185.1 Alcohol dehydrogenase superfamily, zinc-type [Penicillium expansum]
MQAVVFKGPSKVAIEQKPIPQIQDPTDVILKVRYTALCGSELHVFRGHQKSGTEFIMGHEFTGEVVELGSNIKNFQKGDRVVSPFTASCGKCFYCERGFSSRCAQSQLFGTVALDGGQAEYVRIPLADSTLAKVPDTIDEKKLVLMADIFPTGYFASLNAFSGTTPEEIQNSTVLLFGCGPVGICALISALDYKPKTLIAIDSVPSRLALAQSLGAEAWNFKEDEEGLRQRVKKLTDGRGADIVIEVVGHSSALRMGFDLLRPWGRISSVGVHNQDIPWTGNEAYAKNLRLQMGRCPVRSIFGPAMDLFEKKQDVLNFMSQDIRPLSQAVQAYDDFDNMRAHKVIFEADK